jgi:HTH-type transcriptional regulator/antitoxin HigA
MSQADLAARSNLSTKHVNQIIHGIAPITHETALAFERVTSTPARLWNALEAAYRDWLVRTRQNLPSPQDLAWLRTLPVAELQRRGLIVASESRGEIMQSILAFFGVADRTAWERIWVKPAASFRRSKVFRSNPGATASWLRIGELDGRPKPSKPFDAKAFRDVLNYVRRLTRRADFSDDVVSKCAEAGVIVVFVTEIPGCRANGAARWLTPTKALIQLSDRHKREDSFWFSLFHEGGHVLLHSKRDMFVSDGESGVDTFEDEADRFSADFLIPPSYAQHLQALATDGQVQTFADELGIAPGIVVGRLHKEGYWDWKRGNHLIRKLHIVDED